MADGLFKRRALEPDFDGERELAMAMAIFRAVFAGALLALTGQAANAAAPVFPRARHDPRPLAIGAAALAASRSRLPRARAGEPRRPPARRARSPLPAVSVGQADAARMVDRLVVTGTLVAREEVLVAPEIDGLRVVELLADEGDR